jgi:hypothetical protein
MWKLAYEEEAMIRISVPNTRNAKEAYVSKMAYFGSHYEVELFAGGRQIPIVFGRKRQGRFMYFPALEEGINISLHQCDSETIDKVSYLFDDDTSEIIVVMVNQFMNVEGGQKWYGKKPKGPTARQF